MATQQKRATATDTAKAKSSANANKAQDQDTRGESSDTILDVIRCLRKNLHCSACAIYWAIITTRHG